MERVGRAVLLSALLLPSPCCAEGDAPSPAPPGAPAATWHVAPWGDDASPGTLSAPWRTLARAVAGRQPGDLVYLRQGTWNERLLPQSSGAPGAWITFAAYPGESPVIDAAGLSVPTDEGAVDLSLRSFIELRGLEVRRSTGNGIHANQATDLVIAGNRTYDTYSSGIGVWGSQRVTIEDNDVELACNDGPQECLTVAGTVDFEVRGNHVHHGGPGSQGGEGIDIKDGSRNGRVHGNHVHHINRIALYVDAWDKHTYGIEVYANTAHDNGDYGIALVSEKGGLLENVKVYNNLVYDNAEGLGVVNWGEAGYPHPVQDIFLVNNTVVNNGRQGWGGGIRMEAPLGQNVVIRNNLVSQNLTHQIWVAQSVPSAAVVVDHNLIDGFRGQDPEEIRGLSYQEGPAGFRDAAAHDYQLREDSLAVDHGSTAGAPSVDFGGVPRPQGAAPDIGAWELRVAGVWMLVAASGAGDGSSRALWNGADGTAVTWTLDAAGAIAAFAAHGPFAGWTARALEAAPDGTMRLLWTSTSGGGALWRLGATHNLLGVVALGPYPGWTPVDVAAGTDGASTVLWQESSGRVALWRLRSDGTLAAAGVHGPFPGWQAQGIAGGGSGLDWLLWNATSGEVAAWSLVDPARPEQALRFGPYAGWSASGIAADAGGDARLLWTHGSGAAALWRIRSSGAIEAWAQNGPFAGYAPRGVTAPDAARTGLLWSRADGQAVYWRLATDLTFESLAIYGPY